MTIEGQEKKIYAIVGAGGFLGQHLLHLVLEHYQHDPHVLIKIIDKAHALEELHIIFPDDFASKQVQIYFGVDIANDDQLRGVLDGVTTVFHLAAAIAYGRKNKKILQETNVDGFKKIIEHAKKAGVKKIIYVSSFAALGCLDQDNAADETCENHWDDEPYAHYGFSKFLAEQHAFESASDEFNIIVAAPGIMFGPGPGHHASILPFTLALNNKWFMLVPQGGTNIVDVRDVASALVLLAHPQHREGKYLLVAHNVKHHDLLSSITQALNRKLFLIEIPQFLAPILGSLAAVLEFILPKSSPYSKEGLVKAFKFRYFTNQKAVDVLGWTPQFTLEKTIQDTRDWIREHSHG